MDSSLETTVVEEPRTSWFALLVVVPFATAAGIALGFTLGFLAMRWHGTTSWTAFDSGQWRAAERSAQQDARGHTPRQAMTDDLRDRVLRPGLTREEVHALLGAPSRWPIFAGAAWFGAEDEAWWLGVSTSVFRRGCDWLYLDFDAQGKLQRALVTSERAAEDVAP